MKLAMKRSSYACIILLLVVFLAACDKSPQANNVRSKANKPPAYGDILVQGAIGDASNLIPLLASDSASHAVGGLVFNGLVKYDKNMNIVGDLAESWDITNQRETEGKQRDAVNLLTYPEFKRKTILFINCSTSC